MPENTKREKDDSGIEAEKVKNSSAEECENKKKGNWSEDQKEKSYYYDDSYGYEIYNPDEEDEE